MARIRTIKPRFWDDVKVGRISRDARLLYIGLWTFADDLGVVISDPLWLKSKIFPYDQIQVQQLENWLSMLEKTGFICHVTYKEETFIYLPTFSRHQVINKPNMDEVNIPKDALDDILGRNHGTITEQSRNDTGLIPERSGPIIGEEKERISKKKSLSVSPSFESGDTVEKSSSEPTEREREEFFKIFFFKNFKNPAEQVERFVNNYQANGWCKKGHDTPVKDRIALARSWEPKDEAQKNRFPQPFVAFWEDVYDKISDKCVPKADIRQMLYDVRAVKADDSALYLTISNGLRYFISQYPKVINALMAKHYPNKCLKIATYETHRE